MRFSTSGDEMNEEHRCVQSTSNVEKPILAVPEPNSDEMVDLIYKSVGSMLAALPFPISNGDIMGALMYHIVEIGLEGAPTSTELRKDIGAAFERIIAQIESEEATKQ